MEVICMETAAFYALIEEVTKRVAEKIPTKEDAWLTREEAMKRLGISSLSTLQKLRDEGKIRFTQPQKKKILYDAISIDAYLNQHAKATF